jgi:uncharacterized protein
MRRGIVAVVITVLTSWLLWGAAVHGHAVKPLEVTAEALVELLAQGDFAAAAGSFDATMKEALPALKLEQAWNGLVAQVGPYRGHLASRAERPGEHDIVHVTSRFERAVIDVRVVFDQERRIAGLFFVPGREPEPPADPEGASEAPFAARQVTVGAAPWALPGTLLVPEGDGPFPAVVLVHGSGPHDRDQTIGPNKPFRDLAEGLAARGVAVLRYEKRTREHGARLASAPAPFTVQDEAIADALAAVELLRGAATVDGRRVYVLGHSLGGMLAPRIGAQDADIAGLIIAAGLTRPLDETILEQITYIAGLDGGPTEEQTEAIEGLRSEVARIAELTPEDTEPVLGGPPSYWLDLRDYRPARMARELPQRMLILQGSRDYQVTEADFDAWKVALGGREDVTFRLYPELNHLFMAGEGMATPAEYGLPGKVAEEVIADIAAWVLDG